MFRKETTSDFSAFQFSAPRRGAVVINNDPCFDVKPSKTMDKNKMTPEEEKCVRSKCPGDSHPAHFGEYYFAVVKDKKTGEYSSHKFVKEGELDKEKRMTQTTSCGQHGKPNRGEVDGEPFCECTCEPFWEGPFVDQGGKDDCSVNPMNSLTFSLDCFNMPDAYMMECNAVANSVCKPYSLTYRFECARTCQAALGVSCENEKYLRFCAHDPECPFMCVKMIGLFCRSEIHRIEEQDENGDDDKDHPETLNEKEEEMLNYALSMEDD